MYFVKFHTIPRYGNAMGAYISPILNPHLWERYIRYSYWGKLRYGVTAPYLSQNYSRKRPLCDQALKSFYSNHGHVKLKTFTLKPKRLTKNRVQYQSGKCTFQLENENVLFALRRHEIALNFILETVLSIHQ